MAFDVKFTEAEKDILIGMILERFPAKNQPEEKRITTNQGAELITKIITFTI